MKAHFKVLAAALVLSLAAVPAYAVMETAGSAMKGELTFTDFQEMYAGQKPIVAQSQYERYQYQLKHPAPKVTLEISRIREEASFSDFQKKYAGQKPIVAQSEYEFNQYRARHPVRQAVFGPYKDVAYEYIPSLRKK
jgi:hypothetical protein